ncbi:hypothetical protein COSO111634_36490 [Corallococcus soli]
MPTALSSLSAACTAMFIASDVLPMPGRAARMMSSPACRPVSCMSRSMKPVDRPVTPVDAAFILSSRSSVCSISSLTGRRSPSRFFSARRKTLRSASSSRTSSSPVSWLARSWISRPTLARRRRSAWSLTMWAYCTALAASGTTWSNPIRYAGPPTATSCPRIFSSSASVRWSTCLLCASSRIIAAKICACEGLEKSSAWMTSATGVMSPLSASTAPSTARSAARSSWTRRPSLPSRTFCMAAWNLYCQRLTRSAGRPVSRQQPCSNGRDPDAP